MMHLGQDLRRRAAICGAAALSLLLAACLVLPGKFDSSLDLRRDGRFAYSYKGEIWVMGLSKLANMATSGTFEPSTCYTDDDDMKERECSKEELDQQRADWEQAQKDKAEQKKKDAEEMKAILGGIDPADPKAGEELAARLRRQAGWKSVIYKGDGLYEVDFAIAGRLDHDFSFPTIERMPFVGPFIMVNRRADGTVRVDTPAFSSNGQSNPMASMGPLAAMGAAAAAKDKGQTPPGFPLLEGKFAITTDGEILANNTDEGPKADTTGKRLEWAVNVRTQASPTALIRLSN